MALHPFQLPNTRVLRVPDDVFSAWGTNLDAVVVLRSDTLAANTALANVLIGTPRSTASPANTLLVSNTTAASHIAFFLNSGGTSMEFLRLDASRFAVVAFGVAMGTDNASLIVENTTNTARTNSGTP